MFELSTTLSRAQATLVLPRHSHRRGPYRTFLDEIRGMERAFLGQRRQLICSVLFRLGSEVVTPERVT